MNGLMLRNLSKLTKLAIISAAIATASASANAADGDQPEELSRGEAELAQMLEGHVAGEPVRCLNLAQRDRLRVITDTALVFRDGDTLYVNRTNAPQFIDEFDVPVFKPFTSRFCNLDRVEFVSRAGGIVGPSVVLEDFIPYTKPDPEAFGS